MGWVLYPGSNCVLPGTLNHWGMCTYIIVYYLRIVYKTCGFKEIPNIGGLYYLYSKWF